MATVAPTTGTYGGLRLAETHPPIRKAAAPAAPLPAGAGQQRWLVPAVILAFLIAGSALELALLRRPYHDTALGHLPSRTLFSDSLHAGAWPFWFSFGRYSYPLASVQGGMSWSPVGLGLGTLFSYDVWTMALENAIWKGIGLAGAFLFARRHVSSPWGASAVATGYVGGALVHTAGAAIGVSWAFLLTPWLLVAIDMTVAAPRTGLAWCRATGLLALAGMALITTGYPGIWLTAPFFIAPYAVWMALPSPGRLLRVAGAALVGGALAAGMVALLISETLSVPLFGPGAARNAVSTFGGVFRPTNVLSVWLPNPTQVLHLDSGWSQPQYSGLIPALLLCISAPARWRPAVRLLRPLALLAVAILVTVQAMTPERHLLGPDAALLGVLLATLLIFPQPFRRWQRVDVALLLASLAGIVAATSNPIGNALRLHVFPFSILRWNAWYLWVTTLSLSLVAWRTLEQLSTRMALLPAPHHRLMAWSGVWVPAGILIIGIDAVTLWLPGQPDDLPDRMGTIDLAWTLSLLALWALGATAYLVRNHLCRWWRSSRPEPWLLGGALLALASALGAGRLFASDEQLIRSFVTLPPQGGRLLDMAHQALVLIALGVVALRAGTRHGLLQGLAVVTLFDMSLAMPRYGADTDVVIVMQARARLERERAFRFTGNERAPDEQVNIEGALTKLPNMARQPTLVPALAAFDEQMGEPSIFRQFSYFPASWQDGDRQIGDVFVRPEALREPAAPAATTRDRAAAASRAVPERAPDCAGSPGPATAEAAPGALAATVSRLLPDRVILDAAVDCRRLLIFTDTWAPGWRVSIDGAAAQALRVNGAIRGVIVPAGRHTVEWLYRPLYFAPLLVLMGTCALVAVLLVLAPWLHAVRVRRVDHGRPDDAPPFGVGGQP